MQRYGFPLQISSQIKHILENEIQSVNITLVGGKGSRYTIRTAARAQDALTQTEALRADFRRVDMIRECAAK